MKERIHFHSIADYHSAMSLPAPEHPCFSINSVVTKVDENQNDCPDASVNISTDFYAIALKKIVRGDVLYGRKQYDCRNGTMFFLAPNQTFSTKGIKIESEANLILIHPEFLKGHELKRLIEQCAFFDYATSEALHLSPKEEVSLLSIFKSISDECQSNYDTFSRDIILSHVKTILTYSERYYRRQFIQRSEVTTSTYRSLIEALEQHYAKDSVNGLPEIKEIAHKLNMSQRYLSDALKSEANMSAKECIQNYIMERAKYELASTLKPITTIAYELGYEYPQYFIRLFKKKNGITPKEYRVQSDVH